MDTLDLIELWYRALRAEIGISIITTDAPALIAKLREARKHYQSAELDKLMALRSPTAENEVWIVHRKAVDDAKS